MGRRQAYRGSPELKQYHLVQDFSGGMDTQSIDEVMKDNEFRMMKNVELKDKGIIQNRQGFGELKLLSQYLLTNGVFLSNLVEPVLFFRIVKNEGNVLEWAKKYKDYDDFENIMHSAKYDIDILFINEDVGTETVTLHAYTLKLFNDGVDRIADLKTAGTAVAPLNEGKSSKNIETIRIGSDIYIMRSDVNSGTDGIAIYNLETRTARGLFNANAYIPTPFEVESLGYNSLRTNPLTDVADQGFGDYAITGVFLTNADGGYIERVPYSGIFTVNAYQLGATLTPDEVKLTITDQNDEELPYTLVSSSDAGGYFVYSVEDLKLDGVTIVKFKFTAVEFAGYEELQQIKLRAQGFDDIQGGDIVSYEGTKLAGKNTEGYGLSTFALFTTIRVETWLEYTAIPLSPNQYYYVVEGDTFFWHNASSVEVEIFPEREYKNIAAMSPQSGVLYQNEENLEDYYTYNGGTAYNHAADFDVVVYESNKIILPFTTEAFVGSNEDVALIEGIDTQGAHMTKIQDRLVLYRGNTIYFSEIFQYDYFPNTNFILLPISSTDEIVKIKYFRNVWIVFTKEEIWRISGTVFGADMQVKKINDFIGCIARNSVVSINNSLVFLSRNGLYALTQSYYQDGLENVKKLDKQIENIIEPSSDAYGVVYRDQYWLFLPNSQDFQMLKYYYDIDKASSKEKPFTVDEFVEEPPVIEVKDGAMYSMKNGVIYAYDNGYTDFLPPDALEEDIPNYNYTYKIQTRDEDFGYPTHDKKMKSLIIKTKVETLAPLAITIYFNGKALINPNQYTVEVNEYGEIIYTPTPTPNYTIDPAATLGAFVLGKDALGEGAASTHKFVLGEKCKNITVEIEQKPSGGFGLVDMGYIFKLGKVRESR